MKQDRIEIRAGKRKSIVVSNEDRDVFLNALENPPEPNKKLKRAVKYHKRFIKIQSSD